MMDHPDLRDLDGLDRPVFHQVHPARDGVLNALRAAILWTTFLAVMAALPCLIALWRWAV